MHHKNPLFNVEMFPKKFRKTTGSENREDELDEVNDAADKATSDIPPASPGLESLVEQRRVESSQLKKKEKYNEAWEAIRICAESCARQSTPIFRENLEVLKTFSNLMRHGLPDDVKSVILKRSRESPPAKNRQSGESCD